MIFIFNEIVTDQSYVSLPLASRKMIVLKNKNVIKSYRYTWNIHCLCLSTIAFIICFALVTILDNHLVILIRILIEEKLDIMYAFTKENMY